MGGLHVTVLGNGAAFPRPGGACSGFLVSCQGTHVFLDAGNGTFSRLRQHVELDELDAVVVTHTHADHIADILPLMYAVALTPGARSKPLPLYGPDAIGDSVGHLMGAASREMFARVFDIHPVSEPFEVGSLSLHPFATEHPGESFGLRVTGLGRTLVYTSDTAMFPGLVEACRDADLLICEATYLGGTEGVDPSVHMFAGDAGVVAREAGARSLVLTHVLPWVELDDAVAQASAEFAGPVEAAVEGRRYTV